MTNTMPLLPLHKLVTHSKRNAKPEAMEPYGDYILLEHIASGTGEVRPSTVLLHNIGSNKTIFNAGDVLYGKLRPNLRKSCVAEGAGYCSTDILALTPNCENSAYYLAAIMRSETFTAKVMRLVSGANLPRIGLRDLMKMELPWPSGDVQLERLNLIAKETVAVRNDMAELSMAISVLENSFWN